MLLNSAGHMLLGKHPSDPCASRLLLVQYPGSHMLPVWAVQLGKGQNLLVLLRRNRLQGSTKAKNLFLPGAGYGTHAIMAGGRACCCQQWPSGTLGP